VGFALTEVDEVGAERTLAMLRAMDGEALQAELGDPAAGGGVATPAAGSP
jgi:hypothetical protein